MAEQIKHKFSTVDFFGNSEPEDLLDIDFDASIDRYAELLADDIKAEYPDAEIEIEWTGESMMHDQTRVYPEDTYEQHTANEDVLSDIQRIKEDLYGDFARWVVEGFNVNAWTEKTGEDADKADVGNILTVLVGPLECQDATVEIVVLDNNWAERNVVAYRYSTASQDEDWQLGTVEQAVEHAAACYQALNEKDVV